MYMCHMYLSPSEKMTSMEVTLLYGWVLLPLLTTANAPRPCVFPFIYNGKKYSSCTKDGSKHGKLWCSTTYNYDKNPQWKHCALSEYGGNSGGRACVFPYMYKGRTYYTCTNEDAETGNFWCATTGSHDRDGEWSYCADTRLAANSQGPCVFPFTYKGTAYASCTTAGASTGKLWCSLSHNYDQDPKWAYCDSSELRPCQFPFNFNGKSYSMCTRDGDDGGQLWCATTSNYERDRKWKACALQEYEGNSKGGTCVFPFIYKGRTFYTCTDESTENGRFWCGTTYNYDKDKLWSFCADTRLDAHPTGPCVFPFIYNGKTYRSCTRDGAASGNLWCSLTRNHDADPKWTYCKKTGVVPLPPRYGS